MASMHDGESDSEHNALWLYGLPGSGVAVPQAAGAPSLEELELRPAEPAGLNARIWICYGSLTQGLVELVNRLQPPPQAAELEAELERWQADFSRAAVLKRRWRNQVRLVNLCKGGAELLAKELPPELMGGRQFSGAAPHEGPQAGSEVYQELAIRALLECRPGLLNAWLDAEHWADAIGKPAADQGAWQEPMDWRRPMLLERLVLLLWRSDGAGETGLLELQERCAQLEEQLAQERDHGAMLNRYIKQMEKELDHYLADHERAATLAERLPLLLQRARQQLGTCSTLHP
jgi:hypothetical protein